MDADHAPREEPDVSTDLIYYRLHGITGARHVYSEAELRRLASMLRSDVDAYIMFNNMPRVGDAERFKLLLGRQTMAA